MIPRHGTVVDSAGLTHGQWALCIAVFTLMGASLVALLAGLGGGPGARNDADRTVEIARSKMDSLRSLPYASLTSGCDTLEAHFIRRWYVSTNLKTARKSVEILVSWPLTAGHTVAFNTLVGDSRYKALP